MKTQIYTTTKEYKCIEEKLKDSYTQKEKPK